VQEGADDGRTGRRPEGPAAEGRRGPEGLARLHVHRGLLHAKERRYRDSLADLDRGIARLAERRRLDPGNAQLPKYLMLGWRWRAEVLTRLGRPRDADADWDRIVALFPVEKRPEARLQRAIGRARAGDYVVAAAEAEDLARTPSPSGAILYDLACVLAQSASAAARDSARPPPERQELAEGYARRAVGLLRRAREAGFSQDPADRAHLDRDDDLAFLRQRDDYRAFVKTLPPKAP